MPQRSAPNETSEAKPHGAVSEIWEELEYNAHTGTPLATRVTGEIARPTGAIAECAFVIIGALEFGLLLGTDLDAPVAALMADWEEANKTDSLRIPTSISERLCLMQMHLSWGRQDLMILDRKKIAGRRYAEVNYAIQQVPKELDGTAGREKGFVRCLSQLIVQTLMAVARIIEDARAAGETIDDFDFVQEIRDAFDYVERYARALGVPTVHELKASGMGGVGGGGGGSPRSTN